jgi:hypothetical protein
MAPPALQPARLIGPLHGMGPAPPRGAAELEVAPGGSARTGWEDPASARTLPDAGNPASRARGKIHSGERFSATVIARFPTGKIRCDSGGIGDFCRRSRALRHCFHPRDLTRRGER